MKHDNHYLTLVWAIALVFGAILGCNKLKDKPDWTKLKKVAGKAQRLSGLATSRFAAAQDPSPGGVLMTQAMFAFKGIAQT